MALHMVFRWVLSACWPMMMLACLWKLPFAATAAAQTSDTLSYSPMYVPPPQVVPAAPFQPYRPYAPAAAYGQAPASSALPLPPPQLHPVGEAQPTQANGAPLAAPAASLRPSRYANVNSGFYLAAAGGAFFAPDQTFNLGGNTAYFEFDPSFAFSVAAGWKWPFGLRLEFELQYADVDIATIYRDGVPIRATGSNNVYVGSINLYYDFDNSTRYTPYLGGGTGLAVVDSSGFVNATSAYFTSHAEAGIAVALTDNVYLTPSYRFQWLYDGTSSGSLAVHYLRSGLRIQF